MKIYYAREGYGNDKENGGAEVEATNTTSLLSTFHARKLPEPNTVLGRNVPANRYSEYEFVVVRVERDETSPTFPTPGLYLIEGLTPQEYETKRDKRG